MSRRRPHPSFLLNWLSVDRKSLLPLYSQIGDQLRRVIVDGNLAPGDYLPSSRDLASELGISRNTTLQAYDQLIAEGFLEFPTGVRHIGCDILGGQSSGDAKEDEVPVQRRACPGRCPRSGTLRR